MKIPAHKSTEALTIHIVHSELLAVSDQRIDGGDGKGGGKGGCCGGGQCGGKDGGWKGGK
jgi:hypothetical protein